MCVCVCVCVCPQCVAFCVHDVHHDPSVINFTMQAKLVWFTRSLSLLEPLSH